MLLLILALAEASRFRVPGKFLFRLAPSFRNLLLFDNGTLLLSQRRGRHESLLLSYPSRLSLQGLALHSTGSRHVAFDRNTLVLCTDRNCSQKVYEDSIRLVAMAAKEDLLLVVHGDFIEELPMAGLQEDRLVDQGTPLKDYSSARFSVQQRGNELMAFYSQQAQLFPDKNAFILPHEEELLLIASDFSTYRVVVDSPAVQPLSGLLMPFWKQGVRYLLRDEGRCFRLYRLEGGRLVSLLELRPDFQFAASSGQVYSYDSILLSYTLAHNSTLIFKLGLGTKDSPWQQLERFQADYNLQREEADPPRLHCVLCADANVTQCLDSCDSLFDQSQESPSLLPIILFQALILACYMCRMRGRRRDGREFLPLCRCLLGLCSMVRSRGKRAIGRLQRMARRQTGPKGECCVCYDEVCGEEYFPCGRHQVHSDCLSEYERVMAQQGGAVVCPFRD